MNRIFRFLLFFWIGGWILSPSVRCEGVEEGSTFKVLETVIQRDSKPVFDPEIFNEKPPEPDLFFHKLREKRQDFFKEQRERRLKFLTKVRRKNWDSEKMEKALAEFHEKDIERVQKFVRKQGKKIDKHMKKKGI